MVLTTALLSYLRAQRSEYTHRLETYDQMSAVGPVLCPVSRLGATKMLGRFSGIGGSQCTHAELQSSNRTWTNMQPRSQSLREGAIIETLVQQVVICACPAAAVDQYIPRGPSTARQRVGGGYRADRRILTPHMTLRKLVQRGNRFPALPLVSGAGRAWRGMFFRRGMVGTQCPLLNLNDLLIGGGGPDRVCVLTSRIDGISTLVKVPRNNTLGRGDIFPLAARLSFASRPESWGSNVGPLPASTTPFWPG